MCLPDMERGDPGAGFAAFAGQLMSGGHCSDGHCLAEADPENEAGAIRLSLHSSLLSWFDLDAVPLGVAGNRLYAGIIAASPDDVICMGTLALLAIRQDSLREADSLLAVLRAERRPYVFGRPGLMLAPAAALKGERENAVVLLRQAHRNGFNGFYRLHLESDFDSIRDDASCRALIRPIPMRTL